MSEAPPVRSGMGRTCSFAGSCPGAVGSPTPSHRPVGVPARPADWRRARSSRLPAARRPRRWATAGGSVISSRLGGASVSKERRKRLSVLASAAVAALSTRDSSRNELNRCCGSGWVSRVRTAANGPGSAAPDRELTARPSCCGWRLWNGRRRSEIPGGQPAIAKGGTPKRTDRWRQCRPPRLATAQARWRRNTSRHLALKLE